MSDADAIEKTGLLDGLDGGVRGERAELIAWLRTQDFDEEQIRCEVDPMRLPARRALGDDGSRVSARAISETHGINLELLQRIMRALGLAATFGSLTALRPRRRRPRHRIRFPRGWIQTFTSTDRRST